MCQDEIYCWLHKAGLLPSPQSNATLSALSFPYIQEINRYTFRTQRNWTHYDHSKGHYLIPVYKAKSVKLENKCHEGCSSKKWRLRIGHDAASTPTGKQEQRLSWLLNTFSGLKIMKRQPSSTLRNWSYRSYCLYTPNEELATAVIMPSQNSKH